MKRLIEALHVIQEECKKNDDLGCHECPMWSDEAGICCVTDLPPIDWKINDKVQKVLL